MKSSTSRADLSINSNLIAMIAECIQADDMSLFYTSKEWRRLRKTVMKEQKGECQDHKRHGLYEPATMIHHEKEVRKHPSLALSKTYVDSKMVEHRQLTALCDDCHKLRHTKENEQLTIERWD